ncbi:MAG: hypothetical protein ABGY11_00215 [Candidatus Thioglobus sp.]|jgi:hypothetical protein
MPTEIRGQQIKDDSVTGDDIDESTLILDTLRDADGDTKIQIEESADEDKIRFDTAGVERLVINSDGGIAFGNTSVSGAPASWNFFNFKGGGVRVTANNFYCDNDRGVLWGDSSVSIKGNATAASESLTVRANYNAYIHVDGVNDTVGIGTTTPKTGLDIHHNPTSLSDDTGGGEVVTFGTGTLTIGKLYYLETTGVWTEADASVPASGADQMLAIAIGTSPSNGMLIRGWFDATTQLQGSFTTGLAVYMNESSGRFTITAPSTSGAIVRIVGYCTTVANVIYFNPSNNWVELA